jgi:hypothetical protein
VWPIAIGPSLLVVAGVLSTSVLLSLVIKPKETPLSADDRPAGS